MIWALANWKLIAGGVAVLAIIGGIWGYGHSQYNKGYEECNRAHIAAEQKRRDKQMQDIAEIDRKHTKEMERVKTENEKLRAAVRDGTRRLSIRVVPKPATGTPGMDHAETRSDIDPRDAEALVGIANRGDDAIRQLSGCQDYIRAIR